MAQPLQTGSRMNRRVPSILALFLVMLAMAASAAEPATPTTTSLWIKPLFTAGGAYFGGPALAAGVDLRLSPRTSLTLEGSFSSTRYDCAAYFEPPPAVCPRNTTLSLAVGPTFYLTSSEMKGLFVHPKLMGVFGWRALWQGSQPSDQGSVELGLEVGYAFRFGPIVIAPELGASIGYGVQVDRWNSFGFLDTEGDPPDARWVEDLDLNLFRLGVYF